MKSRRGNFLDCRRSDRHFVYSLQAQNLIYCRGIRATLRPAQCRYFWKKTRRSERISSRADEGGSKRMDSPTGRMVGKLAYEGSSRVSTPRREERHRQKREANKIKLATQVGESARRPQEDEACRLEEDGQLDSASADEGGGSQVGILRGGSCKFISDEESKQTSKNLKRVQPGTRDSVVFNSVFGAMGIVMATRHLSALAWVL